MKIQCQSCQAKYTIADEKVLGKVVKIRCKKCSSTIVINGNDQAAQADAGGDGNAFDYAGAGADPWTVNVADGDQRTMSVAEIATEYRNGVVNDETYCWKDGMPDWLPLREIEAIYGAVKGGGAEAQMSVAPSASVPPPAAAPLFGASTVPADAFAGSVSPNGGAGALFSAPAAEAAPAAAARRAGGRGQGGDLFGNVEKAGGEEEVMTSAASAAVAANAAAAVGAPVDDKLTGQRNENSVLFSLSALTETKKDAPAGRGATTATGDGSGLIDIRALSANMDEDKDKKKDKGARVDDIMNLSGGGAFGAALAAPILAPPPLEPVDLGVTAPAEAPKQNKGMMFAILGGCAFIAVGIVVAVVLTRQPAPTETAKPDVSGSTADPLATPTAATSMAANDTPPSTTTGSVNEPAPPSTGGNTTSKPAVVAGPRVGGPAPAAAPKPAGESAPAPAPAAPPKPTDLAGAMGAAVGAPAHAAAPAPAAAGASFDKGAAAAALGKVDVQGCKKADGPTGAGHVTVTFGPDGSVQTAVVDQGPYPGTSVAGCVAGRYRGAHVPAFSGAPVRVGKSFIIN